MFSQSSFRLQVQHRNEGDWVGALGLVRWGGGASGADLCDPSGVREGSGGVARYCARHPFAQLPAN